jgi:hypothetical protein
MRVRKRLSSSSGAPPRSAGIDRFGRSGLESSSFHTGITKKAAIKAIVLRVRRNIHCVNHCPRCDHRLVAQRCPSCDFDSRDDVIDDDDAGDDLDDTGRFD